MASDAITASADTPSSLAEMAQLQLSATTSNIATIATEPRLGRLPAELHINIAEQVVLEGSPWSYWEQDLCELRLVCRSLAEDTFDVFARRCFSVRSHTLRDSPRAARQLERWRLVSEIPKLSRHIKYISFDTDSTPSQHLSEKLVVIFRNLASVKAAEYISFSGHGTAINVAVMALAESGLSVRDIQFYLASGTLNDHQPSIAMLETQLAKVHTLFSGLNSLDLDCSGCFTPTLPGLPYAHFVSMACASTMLQKLRMSTTTSSGSHLADFRCAILSELDLSRMQIIEVDLIRFLGQQRSSIRSLSLADINLQPEDCWNRTLTWLHDNLDLCSVNLQGLTREHLSLTDQDEWVVFVDGTKDVLKKDSEEVDMDHDYRGYSFLEMTPKHEYIIEVRDDCGLVKNELSAAARNGQHALLLCDHHR